MGVTKYFRRGRVFEIGEHHKDCSDPIGEPSTMMAELLRNDPIKPGDRVTIDLRILIERKE